MKEYIKAPHTAIFTAATGFGKILLVLDLNEIGYNKHFECFSISAQRSSKIKHIILEVESNMMTMFGLQNQRTSYIIS